MRCSPVQIGSGYQYKSINEGVMIFLAWCESSDDSVNEWWDLLEWLRANFLESLLILVIAIWLNGCRIQLIQRSAFVWPLMCWSLRCTLPCGFQMCMYRVTNVGFTIIEIRQRRPIKLNLYNGSVWYWNQAHIVIDIDLHMLQVVICKLIHDDIGL